MPTGGLGGDKSDPWRRLLAGVLLQAVLDLREGRPWKDDDGEVHSPDEARDWLAEDPAARAIAEALEMEESLQRWLSDASMHGMRAPSPRRGGRGDSGTRRYAPDCA